MAGTRPRGSTSEEDTELLQDLLSSEKDRIENIITSNFIRDAFNQLRDKNFLCDNKAQDILPDNDMFFIRRLRHLQHLCQSFEGNLREDNCAIGKNSIGYKFLFLAQPNTSLSYIYIFFFQTW